MKIFIVFVTLSATIYGFVHFFTEYKSAFEADQQCHYEMRLRSTELDGLDCDHDLETNQWLLYQNGLNGQPSKVIERFRY
tara:strand:- start:25 stop:264 length:240 start_codon:yes stop_codon:yes gene_type:complete